MLGNLSTDMTKQGVTIVAKGNCAACDNPIVGQVQHLCSLLYFHEILQKLLFFTQFLRESEHVLRSWQVITALGRIWHPEHFVCEQCQQELGTRNFFEHSGKAYCERDYHMLYSPRCFHCNGAILDVSVTSPLHHKMTYSVYTGDGFLCRNV